MLHSHSGALARNFRWKGSRCRHSPRSCNSIAGSSIALTGGSSGLRFLLGRHPHLATLHQAPAATSIARTAMMAAPTRMSAWWRKKLIPAREGPWPHPACPSDPHCAHKVPHIMTAELRGETWSCGCSSSRVSISPAALQKPSQPPPGQSISPKPPSQRNI